MAIDKTRGTGPDKTTEAAEPRLDAGPAARGNEAEGSSTPDSARGGCLKLGWGCLPVLIAVAAVPPALFL